MSHAYDVVSHDAAEETIYPSEWLHEDPNLDIQSDLAESNDPNERLISADRGARFRSGSLLFSNLHINYLRLCGRRKNDAAPEDSRR